MNSFWEATFIRAAIYALPLFLLGLVIWVLTTRSCPNCGKRIPKKAKFCLKCKRDLDGNP